MMTPVVTCDRLASSTRPVANAVATIADRDDGDTDDPTDCAAGQRVRDGAPVVAEIAPEDDVLREAQRHPDGCGAEPPVEADAGLQQAGDQRSDERAEVDAQVEKGEAAVATRVVLVVQRAEQR